jgi:hypothetical protein
MSLGSGGASNGVGEQGVPDGTVEHGARSGNGVEYCSCLPLSEIRTIPSCVFRTYTRR